MLQFYNTLGREIQEFKPIAEGKVKIYSCGPTVYNYAHIGNLRAMIVYDLVKKYLLYKGFAVEHVMNITDVDDKTIKSAKEEGKSLKEFTQFYTEAFLEDLITLGIDIPKTMPRATEEIESMIQMVEILLDKGFAYKTEDGVYFSIRKFEKYGKLALLQLENLKENADGRLDDEYDKDDARDFALWKFETEGDAVWEAPFGKGRPGWHIECSAMSHKYLGQPFDIHLGGCDLIFPHHTNEIAQSECAFGKKFCNYWIHNEHLLVNGEKMAKSAGNFYTLRDLLAKGYNPKAIRYELIATHYRQQLDFTENHLKQIPATLQKFYDFFTRMNEITEEKENSVDAAIEKYRKKFEDAMDMDLNISGGLAAIFDFMKEVNKMELGKKDAEKVVSFMEEIDSVLGVMTPADEDIPQEIYDLADARQKARTEKNFEESDRIRDELKERGYVVEDKPDGFRVKKIL